MTQCGFRRRIERALGPILRHPGRRMGPLLLSATLALAACESMAEPIGEAAYDFTLPVDGGVVYRWPAGSVVRLYVQESGDPARDALLMAGVDSAAADWLEALGPGRVDLVRTGDLREADVVVRWSDAPLPVDATTCAPVVTGRAATTFCPTPDLDGLERFPLIGADSADHSQVRMLVTVLAEEAVGPRRVRQLVAHELGHVLGIGRHSPDPEDLMWDGPLGTDRPSPADRATIRDLYRTPPRLIP